MTIILTLKFVLFTKMSTEEDKNKPIDCKPGSSSTMEANSSLPSGKNQKKGIRFPFLDKFRRSSQEKKELQRRRSSAGGGDEDVPRKKSGGHLNVDHEPHSTPTF